MFQQRTVRSNFLTGRRTFRKRAVGSAIFWSSKIASNIAACRKTIMASSSQKKKQLRKYNKLLDEALALNERVRLGGDIHIKREAADKLLEAVLAAPSPWIKGRFALFTEYCKCVSLHNISDAHTEQKRRVFYTKNDVKILKQNFVYNEEEPYLYRAYAANTLAIIRNLHERDDHSSVEYFRYALDYIEESLPEDKERVIANGGPSVGDVTVGSALAELETLVRYNLAKEEGKTPSPSLQKKVDGIPTSQNVYVFHKKRDDFDDETRKKQEELLKRTRAGGFSCDGCKKSKEDLGIEELRRCGRCKLHFYCSPICANRAWKAGHKKACRKKGEVKVGDDMKLEGLETRTDLNGHFVKVIGPGAVEGKWIVKPLGSDAQVSVSTSKLVRLRPVA